MFPSKTLRAFVLSCFSHVPFFATLWTVYRLPGSSVHGILQARILKLLRLLFSGSVMSNSLGPHELQHARLPCPSHHPEIVQTHVHWVGDAIQPSHPLSSPSPPAVTLSQHQGLFQLIRLYIRWSKYWSFSLSISSLQSIFQDWFPLGLISLQSKGLSRVFFNTTVKRHQFFSTQLSLWPNSHIHTWLL